MKIRIIQIIFFTSIFLSFQSFAETINEIEFSGLNVITKSTLISKLPVKVGDEFTSETSNEIIKVLFETGNFSDIKVESSDSKLLITLMENPHIKSINVETESDFNWSNWLDLDREKALLNKEATKEIVKEHKLSPGDVFNKKKLFDMTENIKFQYTAAGFFNVDITEILEIDSQNRIDIQLDVNQGKRAKIDSINITGSKVFSEEKLLKQLSLGAPRNSFINFLFPKDKYTDVDFNQSVESLNIFYMNSGYLDFKVTNINKTLSDNQEKINIEIFISEGIQYKLGNVSFEGELGNQSVESLMSLLSIKKGDIFNWQEVVSDVQKITDVFADQGYAFVNVNPTTDDVLDTVNIYFDISLNKKVYVNRITISGNTRTQDEVIRREIGVSEGSLFSRSSLKKSIIKLRRLGYFSDVQMEASKVEGVPDKIDINFALKETKTGELSFTLSHSNNYGVSFGAGIKEKNIFGSGNTFNAELLASEHFRKISIYFMDPHINSKSHSISYGAFYSKQSDDDIMTDSYTINSKGVNLGYGVPLTEEARINIKLEYANNEILCSSGFKASGYEPTQCGSSDSDEIVLGVNWSGNTLNDYLYPTDGSRNFLGVDAALPLSDYRYVKLDANHVSYQPISDNLTLKLTGNIGLINGYNGKEVPFFKRYFGGGTGSVRGFKNRSLGPLYPNSTAKGGELSVLGSANIISPISFIEDNENMRMSVFLDTGNVYDKSSNLKLKDLRMSAGFAFAYLSPIGAIGAYWSRPLIKKSGDTVENFGFSLGTGF